MRTLLICHDDEPLDRVGLARWLASFSTLVGLVVLRETAAQRRRRVMREVHRVGLLRFVDVLAFRAYYAAFLSRADAQWEQQTLKRLCETYPDLPASTPVLFSRSPNAPECRDFIARAAPDVIIARCKVLLKEAVFRIPSTGTFVMHPGVCPEYRNSHGCFWALANGHSDLVAMTLLKVDSGVDTGPVYGYYRPSEEPLGPSHIVIQHRTVFDNLKAIQQKLIDIHMERAVPIDVSGRVSAVWGQPWLSRYVRWRRAETAK